MKLMFRHLSVTPLLTLGEIDCQLINTIPPKSSITHQSYSRVCTRSRIEYRQIGDFYPFFFLWFEEKHAEQRNLLSTTICHCKTWLCLAPSVFGGFLWILHSGISFQRVNCWNVLMKCRTDWRRFTSTSWTSLGLSIIWLRLLVAS